MPVKIGYAIADISTLKALPTVDLLTGYGRLVTSVSSWFIYNSTSTATSDDVTVLLPSSGVGRWFKQKAWVTISDVIGIGSLASLSSVDLSGSNATGILAAARFPALTGSITTSAGNLTTTLATNAVGAANIAANAVTTAKIADNNVTLSKLPTQATNTLLGNNSGSAAAPSVLSPTQVKTLLAIDGNLDISWSSPLSVANGGTGVTTLTGFFNAISPITTQGDLIYGSGVNTATRLAGNISGTRKFLGQSGDNSSIAFAPSWISLIKTDITDLADFTYTTSGLVPFPGGSGTTRFLREDGAWATAGGASGNPITVQDEGITLTAALTTLNFTGDGVVASNTGGDVLLTIPGAVDWDDLSFGAWDAMQ